MHGKPFRVEKVEKDVPLNLFFNFKFFYSFQSQNIDPWLAFISLGIVASSLCMDITIKIYLATCANKNSQNIQNKIFDKLLNAPLEYFYSLSITEVLGTFSANIFDGKHILN